MASKLSIYNAALTQHLGERKLSSLSENTVMRRRLDSIWDNDFVRDCLQQGLWNFAMNAVELSYSPSVEPSFGFTHAFDKPADWVRTAIVSIEPSFCAQFLEYEDEGDYWYADPEVIYVKYVSDHDTWGNDLSRWTAKFARYVEANLAWRVAKSTTGSNADADDLEKLQRRLLIQAKAGDAMDEATRMPSQGTWSRARAGRFNREDR